MSLTHSITRLRSELIRGLWYAIFALAAYGFFVPAASAASATLYLSPPTGVYTAGGTFTVRVLVDSGGVAINAAEGVLEFNNAELSVVGVSQSGSIFNLWTVDPTFSNTKGTISFGGGTPKGYTGSAGSIMTITFKALRESTSKVNFISGVVLAADGLGTNIIASMNGGTYTLTSKKEAPKQEYVAPVNTPAAPNIVSATHPDQEGWYALPTAELSWDVPSDVSAVRLLVDQISYSIPAVYYSTPISEKTIDDLDDGVWYFHAQMQNRHGWGKVAHFRIGVDTQKPEYFSIKEPEERDSTDPSTRFIFDASDVTSGIAYYEVQFDDHDPERWIDDGSHTYVLPALAPGKHTLIAKAVDGAGNYLVDSKSFTIEALEPPVFTQYPDVLNSGAILVVRGESFPGAEIVVWIEKNKDEAKEYRLKSDEGGIFSFISEEKLDDGVYRLWAEAIDDRGARSKSSESITIAVKQSGIIRIGTFALNVLSVIVPLAGLLALLIFLFIYTRHKYVLLRRRLRKEVREAEAALEDSFNMLQKEAKKIIALLEKAGKKRSLTKEEGAVAESLKKGLQRAEKTVKKEIHDIDIELKK